MNRRGFFQVVAGAAVAPKVLPQDALGLWPGKVSTPVNGALTPATIRSVESQIQVGSSSLCGMPYYDVGGYSGEYLGIKRSAYPGKPPKRRV